MKENGGLVEQPLLAGHLGDDLGKDVLVDPLVGLVGQLLAHLSGLLVGCLLDEGVDVQARVPDLQRTHLRVVAQVFPVGAHAFHRGIAGLSSGQAIVTPGDHEAGGQALDVPLPGRGEGLVEVVDVEHQVALGGGEETEVEQVAVAAGLHADAGAGHGRQVVGHQAGRAAQEGEGAAQHAPVADRHQLLQAVLVGLLEDGDGVAALGRRLPGGMLGPWEFLAQRTPGGDALVAGAKDGRLLCIMFGVVFALVAGFFLVRHVRLLCW
ncbi:hypothetical protein D3C78_454290 [compost metagenome]